MTSVGLIGLGKLGAMMAAGLSREGHPALACFDIDPDQASQRCRQFGLAEVPLVASPASVAAACDVVFVAVFDETQVDSVLFGDEGIAASTRRPLRVVLMSTVSIPYITATASALADRGIELVDCGVNGAPGIDEGKTVFSVGATPEAFAVVRPVLELLADPAVHMGPVGAGMKTKLMRNMIVYATWFAGSLGAELAVSAGVSPAGLVEVVDASEKWTRGAMHLVRRALEPGESPVDPSEENSITRVAHKDLGAALRLAAESGVDLPMIAEIDRRYSWTQTVRSAPA